MTDKQKLEYLDMMALLHARQAIISFAFAELILFQFEGKSAEEKKQVFKLNPANTYLYRAIKSHGDQELVSLIEFITESKKTIGEWPIQVKNKWDLVNHRNFISHPSTYEWRVAEMQKFYEEEKHYKQHKGKTIWDAKKSIEAEIINLGGSQKNFIQLSPETSFVSIYQLILEEVLIDPTAIPPRDEISKFLVTFFQEYPSFLDT